MREQHRLPEPVAEQAKELKKERDFSSVGEAVRYMCREGGYDV
jgi:Arc/MetJ-type ribon-helix-helix transcriptional regulator